MSKFRIQRLQPVIPGGFEVPDGDLKHWVDAPPFGLEFGAPALTREQVLDVLSRNEEDVREYFRLLAQNYDRPRLLQLVDSLCAALVEMDHRNN